MVTKVINNQPLKGRTQDWTSLIIVNRRVAAYKAVWGLIMVNNQPTSKLEQDN